MAARKEIVKKIEQCRACKSKSLKKIIDLGPQPNANSYLRKDQIEKEEYYFPLDLMFCTSCSFLQLGHAIRPEILFGDYIYVSSTSPLFVEHFQKYAKYVSDTFHLSSSDLVVDIGSNDGALLLGFKKHKVKVLGVDPVKEIARVAKKQGVETITKFFSPDLAKEIIKKKGKVMVACANNTFAQISDLDGLVKGLTVLLDKDGIFVMEVPYVVTMLKKMYFDLIYHEHHTFPAIKPLMALFDRFGMEIFDAHVVPVHGGTIRVFVKKHEGRHTVQKSVKHFLQLEEKMKLHEMRTYQAFAMKIQRSRVKLLRLLDSLSSQKKVIVGYGAPAKANTLLNYCNIGMETLDFIVDDSEWKQGRYTPGKRIPVVSSRFLDKKKADYMLILAWNFADAIMKKNQAFKESGGKFIIPFPNPKII